LRFLLLAIAAEMTPQMKHPKSSKSRFRCACEA
jgi:hypothetical protein